MAKLLLDHTTTATGELLSAGRILDPAAFELAHTAVRMGNVSVLKLMLSHAKNAELTWSLRRLLATHFCPSEAVLRLLLDHYDVRKDNPSISSVWGEVLALPLYLAARDKNAAVVRLLLERGAETEHRRGDLKKTPYQVADSMEVKKILLEAGASMTPCRSRY